MSKSIPKTRVFLKDFVCHRQEVEINDKQVVHQLTRVLRLKRGDRIVLLNNTGIEYAVELQDFSKAMITGKLLEQRISLFKPSVLLTVYLPLIKKERFEWALEKLTELGVSKLVPIISERTVVKKTEIPDRWQTIIRESAEQCERATLMELGGIVDYKQAVERASGELKLIGMERQNNVIESEAKQSVILRSPQATEGSRGLSAECSGIRRGSLGLARDDKVWQMVDLFIGPEGGWTETEQQLAQKHGILSVHLPNTVLRTETAAVALATLVLYSGIGDTTHVIPHQDAGSTL